MLSIFAIMIADIPFFLSTKPHALSTRKILLQPLQMTRTQDICLNVNPLNPKSSADLTANFRMFCFGKPPIMDMILDA